MAESAEHASPGTVVLVRPRSILRALLIVAGALAATHFVVSGLVFVLDLDAVWLLGLVSLNGENNPATWFGSVLLFTAAVLLALLATVDQAPRDRRRWKILSVAVLVASIDEVAMFHERVGIALSESLDLTGIFLYAWVIPVGLAFAVGAVVFATWLWRQAPPAGRLVLTGTAIYLSGALGLELVQGWWDSTGGRQLVSYALTGFEETMEMVGCAVAVYGLLLAIESMAARVGPVSFHGP